MFHKLFKCVECLSVNHMHAVPCGLEEATSPPSPQKLELQMIVSCHTSARNGTRCLEEQQVLLTIGHLSVPCFASVLSFADIARICWWWFFLFMKISAIPGQNTVQVCDVLPIFMDVK